MKILRVSSNCIKFYRENVKGNEDVLRNQIERKLTRNVALAKEVLHEDKFQRSIGTRVYHYGNLHITVRWGKVIDIVNHTGGYHYAKGWKKDMKKYKKLTKELGIYE